MRKLFFSTLLKNGWWCRPGIQMKHIPFTCYRRNYYFFLLSFILQLSPNSSHDWQFFVLSFSNFDHLSLHINWQNKKCNKIKDKLKTPQAFACNSWTKYTIFNSKKFRWPLSDLRDILLVLESWTFCLEHSFLYAPV